MTLRTSLAVAMTLMLAGVQAAGAQTPPAAGGPGPGAPVQRQVRVFVQGPASPFVMLLRAAHLTDAQEQQVRQILQTNSARSGVLMKDLQAAQDALAAKLLGPGKLGDADVDPLEDKVESLKRAMDRSMIDASLEIRNVLTAEQLARLQQVHQKLESLRTQIESLIGPGPGGIPLLPPG